MQSIAYVLALKRELASTTALHDEENEKRDAREACLHDIITDQQERIEQLKSAVALKELWARVLSFQQVGTYSLPAYDASTTPRSENNHHEHDQGHAASAMTFVSAAVAKEMDAAVPGSAMPLLLESVRAMSPALDGVMTTLSEENFQLRALLDDRSIAASLDKARVVKLREEAERARLEAEEMRAVAVEHGQLVQRQQAEMAALQRRIRQLEFNGECLQSELSDSKLSSPLDLAELEETHHVHDRLITPSTRPCIPTATPPNFSGLAAQHASPIPVLSLSLTSSMQRHVQRQQYARGERDDPAQPAKHAHSHPHPHPHSHSHSHSQASGKAALTTPDAAAAIGLSRRSRGDPAVVSPPPCGAPAAAGPPSWSRIAASDPDKENVDPRGGKKPLSSVRREKVHVALTDDCFEEEADVAQQVLSAMQIINGLRG